MTSEELVFCVHISAVQEERGPRKATKPTKDVGGATGGTSSPRISPNYQSDISSIKTTEKASLERRIQQVCAQLHTDNCIAAESGGYLYLNF